NTAGGDRPNSDANGKLPLTAGATPEPYLQFPPHGATGQDWNQAANYDGGACAPAPLAAGQWKIKVTPKDLPNNGFTTNAFFVATATPTATATFTPTPSSTATF